MFNIILKEYRHIKCLSQEELSYQLEVSTNHIRNIELGKIYPSEKLIQKIIKCIQSRSICPVSEDRCKRLMWKMGKFVVMKLGEFGTINI